MARLKPFPKGNRMDRNDLLIASFVKGLPTDRVRIVQLTARFLGESAVRRTSMSFALYAVGYLIVIAGVAYLAHLMHIPQTYITAVVVILVGVGVVTGVMNTRHKDPS